MARQKGYVALNLLGLTIGFASTLIILLYLSREISFESNHVYADRIYRIGSHVTEPDQEMNWCFNQVNLGPALKAEVKEVEHAVRFQQEGNLRLLSGDRPFTIEKAFLTDSTFNEVFTYRFIYGDASRALARPNEIVLSKSLSEKIYGPGVDPVGQLIKSEDGLTWNVVGVYEDQPGHTHLQPECLASIITLPYVREMSPDQWGNFGIYTYALLYEGADPQSVPAQLDSIIQKHVAVIFDQFNIKIRYSLDPILDIHLHSTYQGEPEPVGKMEYVVIFTVVAVFMLLIAIINYINLSTARSAQRAGEVGIRKVLGSPRMELINQFLAESLLLALFSAILSIGLVVGLLPAINGALDLKLDAQSLLNPASLAIIGGVILLAGVGGGMYPAILLSRFKPVEVLKGKPGGKKRDYLRMGLVVFQFIVTIFMLAATGVVYDQLRYVREKNLGFDRENVAVVLLTHPSQIEKWTVFRDKLRAIPGVRSVGSANSSPGEGFNKILFKVENNEGVMEDKGVDNFFVDFEFFDALGIELSQGRFPQPLMSTDSNKTVVVNEAFVTRMGWTEPLGKRVRTSASPEDSLSERTVIGVIKNYHHQSLYKPIDPLMFIPGNAGRYVHIRLGAAEEARVMQAVRGAWDEVYPTLPMESRFVNETLSRDYKEDEQRGMVFGVFALLTAIIACLGLVGLASFMAQQRTREIGIRKILGAEDRDIFNMISREFLILTSIALLPAWGLAAYYLSTWLETFAYRTSLRPATFLIAAGLAIGLSFLATTYHALSAARANPARSIRIE